MQNILFIAEFFPPPQHSGTLRSEAFVRYLPDFGINPIVLTNSDAAGSARKFGINCTDSSDVENPNIRRLKWNPKKGGSLLGQVCIRIPVLNSMIRNHHRNLLYRRISVDALAIARESKCKAIYVTSPPPEALILGMHLSKRLGIPFVADIRDPWSHQPSVLYRHYVDFVIERRLEQKVLNCASRVIVTANATATLLANAFQLPSSKIRVIENGYDERDFQEIRDRRPKNDIFTIVHAGQFTPYRPPQKKSLRRIIKSTLGFDYDPLKTDGSSRSLDLMLDVIVRLFERYPDLSGKIQVNLVGCDGNAFEILRKNRPSLDCVVALPRVDAATAAKCCTDADLLVLLQTSTFLRGAPFCVAIAAKIYTYLKTGRRILVSSQGSEMGDMVHRYNAGISVPERDIEAMVEAIRSEYLDWENHANEYRELRNCDELSRRHRANLLAQEFKSLS